MLELGWQSEMDGVGAHGSLSLQANPHVLYMVSYMNIYIKVLSLFQFHPHMTCVVEWGITNQFFLSLVPSLINHQKHTQQYTTLLRSC